MVGPCLRGQVVAGQAHRWGRTRLNGFASLASLLQSLTAGVLHARRGFDSPSNSMPPRRRAAAGGSRAATTGGGATLLSLPDSLLIEILRHVDEEER